MKKSRLMGRILGIALVFLLAGAVLATAFPLANLGRNQVSAQEGVSYIIVHALNPEGVEIASIEGMNPYNVEIYDGDTLIGYGAHDEETYNKPIAISPGAHTIKAKFNGMELQQNIDLAEGETKVLTFAFSRVEYDLETLIRNNLYPYPVYKLWCVYLPISFPFYDSFNEWYVQSLHIYEQLPQESGLEGAFFETIGGEEPTYPPNWNWASPFRVAWVSPPEQYYYQNKVLDTNHMNTVNYVYFRCSSPRNFIIKMASVPYDLLGTGVRCEEVQPPVAAFTHSLENPEVGEEITFDASSSYDPDGEIVSYDWDFDASDGIQVDAEGEIVTYAYSEAGEYSVKLIVTDNDGLTDSTSKVVEVSSIPPIASFKLLMEREFELLDLEFPMVGGKIIFDARDSYDPHGEIVNYEWDFGDGTVINTPFPDWDPDRDDVIYHVYQSPGKYTVMLTVTDDEGETDSDDTILDLTLEAGDLLLCRSENSWVPGEEWTHVGMYVGDDEVVEAVAEAEYGERVIVSPLSSWSWPSKTYVRALSVATADPQIRGKAVQFAKSKVGQPYDKWSLVFLTKQADGNRWYCSELVWAAYLNESNRQIDLDNFICAICGNAVSPYEIDLDSNTHIIGEHKEIKPATKWDWDRMWGGVVYSPVDLIITDPDGFILSKQGSEILGATYEETDIDEDGELDDLFAIPERKTGDYLIQVIPEPDALPTDIYNLEVAANGETIILAEDVQISDIPSEPYVFNIGAELNGLPNIPSDPSPLNHAAGVSINADLSWTGGDPDAGDTVTYHVYFGTSTTPPLKETIGPYSATQSLITYDPGTLVDGRTYYWQIVARDNHRIAREGPLWEFTVGSSGPTETWNLPYGLDADPASVNIWTYPEDAVTVTLADVDTTMPDGLLIWYYAGPVDGWLFYKKGWGAVNTLETLTPGEGYIGIVPTASVWEIPQG
jgi:PKD repeat protein